MLNADTEEFYGETDVIALSFATRQILSDLDHDLIIQRALENMTDFGRSSRVGLWLLNDQEQTLTIAGGMISGNSRVRPCVKSILDAPVRDILANRTPTTCSLIYEQDLPWPTADAGIPERECLCMPLIAADNRVIGMVTFDHPAGFAMSPAMMQPLIVLLTVVAIGLETARLFRLAVIDGLTGLYVRRYMELRLTEEVNRVKRYGGQTAVMITDIDHFKKFNDTYGHQQGDVVLRETAEMMQQLARTGIDVVCRYGGEEFVVIMPSTDTAGAMKVAERIRRGCDEKGFSGPEGPLHVTLSGGVAVLDQTTELSGLELLHRADEALYRAKENGRNKVYLWSDTTDGIS